MSSYKNRNVSRAVDPRAIDLELLLKVDKKNLIVVSGTQPSLSVATNATGNFTFTPTLPSGVVLAATDILFYYPGLSAGLDYAYLNFSCEFNNATSVSVKYYNTSGVTANITAGTGRLLIVKAGLNA